jgi:hypothetical protein
MNICPVADLERQTLAAMDAQDAAERAGDETVAAEARARVAGLREAQTRVRATSKRGLLLQLLELDIAVDGEIGATDGGAEIVRLIETIQKGVDALMPEAA